MRTALIAWIGGHRLALLAAACAACAVGFRLLLPAFTWIPLAGMFGTTAVLLARTARDRAVTRLVGACFGVRCALTVTLFFISALHLPILPSLHRGEGLWEFGGDGDGYHVHAVKLLDAWHSDIDLPSAFIAGDIHYDLYKGLSLPMAVAYEAMGTSPLHFMLLNSWASSLCGLLAFLLARRLGCARHAALVAAAAIAFWPSSLLWSTQLLKDPLVLALMLLTLLLSVALWQRYTSPGARRFTGFADVAQWSALAAAAFGMTYFRHYLGTLLAFAVAGVCAIALVGALRRRSWTMAATAVALPAVLAAATFTGITVDLLKVLSPSHPEIGHVRRAERFRERGDVASALVSYRRAIELNPAYAPAYRGLGVTLLEQRDRAGARTAFNSYLGLIRDPQERIAITNLVAPPAPDQPRPSPRADARAEAPDQPRPSPRADARAEAPTASAVQTPPALVARAEAPMVLTPTAPSIVKKVETIDGVGRAGIDLSKINFLQRWYIELQWGFSWLSVSRLSELRAAQASAEGGTSTVDDAPPFETWSDLAAYVPRAIANAYLAPFPWQLAYTGGHTGVMRPLAAPEIFLIALILPAFFLASWRGLRQFRPETWIVILFALGSAVAHGLIMANGGTLFRLRLQFLFPSLILAASAFPPFVYRFVAALAPPAETVAGSAPDVSAGV